MIRFLLVVVLIAVIALTEQGKPPESVCAGVVHGQTMTATGTRWAEKAGRAVHDLANLAEGTVTAESWDQFKHRLWVGVLKLWWDSFIAGGNGQLPPPEVLKLREQQKQAEDQALLDCAIRMQNLLCPPTVGQSPLDTAGSNLTGAALAADALRKAAPDDPRWLGQIPLGVSIAKQESRFRPRAANFIFGGHVGFWQISGPNAARLKLGDRNDPYANARYAYALWKGRGGTWARDWTTYAAAQRNVGAFQQYANTPAPAGASGTVPSSGDAAEAIQAMGKRLGADPITPHVDPQGLPAFDLMSTGSTRDAIGEEVRTHPGAYNARYVITNMRIASPNSHPAWSWRTYHPITGSGDFRHVHHVHVSYSAGKTDGTGGTTTPDPGVAAGQSCPAAGGAVGNASGTAPGSMLSGLRVGTWNTYFGARHSGQSGPSGPARIRIGVKKMTALTDVFGLQEMSEQSHKRAARAAAGPGWGWVGMNTSHPIAYRKSALRLADSHVDAVFKRGYDYEGPSQGDRYVVTAVLNSRDGKALTYVNDHQLPSIEEGGHLLTDEPKRVGFAKAIWRKALQRGDEGRRIGVSIIGGDQNFPGDPEGMFARDGYARASARFPGLAQAGRGSRRVIDEFYYSAGTPSGEMVPGNWGSDHSGRVLIFPTVAAAPDPAASLATR